MIYPRGPHAAGPPRPTMNRRRRLDEDAGHLQEVCGRWDVSAAADPRQQPNSCKDRRRTSLPRRWTKMCCWASSFECCLTRTMAAARRRTWSSISCGLSQREFFSEIFISEETGEKNQKNSAVLLDISLEGTCSDHPCSEKQYFVLHQRGDYEHLLQHSTQHRPPSRKSSTTSHINKVCSPAHVQKLRPRNYREKRITPVR